jgi:glycosidase
VRSHDSPAPAARRARRLAFPRSLLRQHRCVCRQQRAVRGPGQWNHEWARGAVFYEVFVRSFADSNGDSVGDLNGLIAKLDYLNDGDPATTTDLGVDGIWLMPIFESPSYHGYDTIDYEKIEQDYGSNADFQRLLQEAHKRGIRVILDFVMNHTSSQHPWFIDSALSPNSPKRDWYIWSTTTAEQQLDAGVCAKRTVPPAVPTRSRPYLSPYFSVTP